MKLEIFLIVLLLGCIGITTYLVYVFYLSPEQNFTPITPFQQNNTPNQERVYPLSNADYPEGLLFYPNMRFPDKTISYSISSECTAENAENARKGFSLLQEQTILSFSEETLNGRIKVSCSPEAKKIQESEYFIAGEGGPTNIINTTKYYVILNGTILLYGQDKCERPIVSIHETLHVLGFKHSTNKASIMYNFSECDQEIDPQIISQISLFYKDPSVPDIQIDKVNATKKGQYLNFEIEITNIGLLPSPATQLLIYANDKQVSDYQLNSIEIGEGERLIVENLKIPISTEKISFIIDPQNTSPELERENNAATLLLE
jgi:hypothetical protein